MGWKEGKEGASSWETWATLTNDKGLLIYHHCSWGLEGFFHQVPIRIRLATTPAVVAHCMTRFQGHMPCRQFCSSAPVLSWWLPLWHQPWARLVSFYFLLLSLSFWDTTGTDTANSDDLNQAGQQPLGILAQLLISWNLVVTQPWITISSVYRRCLKLRNSSLAQYIILFFVSPSLVV